MTYDEMLSLTEDQLEAQKVTKGARHKIVISILKLKERQNLLRSLEKDVLEGSNLRAPLQELHQMIMTPIKAFSGGEEASMQRHLLSPEGKNAAPGSHLSSGGGEAESGTSVIAEGDLPSQFTRVMGKVCTQLLVSRSDEDNISSYLQLIDKCLIHESFTETQKKRLLSWKQQVQRLFRSIPRKTLLDIAGYRPQRSRFGQSNSLPTASCVGSSVSARRSLRQFQMPSRSLPGARPGLLGSGGLLGPTPRSSSSTPTGPKQGRQGLWFANPGGSNSMPSRTHSSVQRTRSLPVHTTPQTMVMFQQADLQLPVTEPDINNRLESLCLSMTEHALGAVKASVKASSWIRLNQNFCVGFKAKNKLHRVQTSSISQSATADDDDEASARAFTKRERERRCEDEEEERDERKKVTMWRKKREVVEERWRLK
ncbi:Protein Smaug-like protein 1 [Larimichthys crocea]|uniref:Uncharacterized protein n=1 Tax=Larimichthys crocea TaxID=215358 RepID=A0ACD3R0Z3_LARCR|nr:Protein Smaug-like protein 1 [Larimichthys crocea]